MGVIRTNTKDENFYYKKRLVIQYDTYCNTGCKYCFLASIKSNPIKYNPDRLDSFLNSYNPENVTLYGGDTFINHELLFLLLNKIIKIDSVKRLSNVMELIKLERDLDIITNFYNICYENNKDYTLSFSVDFIGKKKLFDFQNIKKLSEKVNKNKFMLNTVLTPEIIDEIYNDIDNIVEEININYSKIKDFVTLENKITINFEAVEKPIKNFEIKVKKIFNALDKCLIKPIITGEENFKTFGCEARDITGVFIDLNGDITACAKMLPEYDLDTKISALDFNKDNLSKVYNLLLKFKNYNDNIIMDKCKKCKARYICSPCPKTIQGIYKENFKKDTILCQFYKTQYETIKENKNIFYYYYKNILRKLKITKY